MKHIETFKVFESKTEIEDLRDKASKYKSYEELRRKDPDLYRNIQKRGLQQSIFPRNKKWSEEAVREEAKKYKSKGQFSRLASGAYHSAKGLGILDELFNK
jgi:transcriptional accessory protein Tex/SPT6